MTVKIICSYCGHHTDRDYPCPKCRRYPVFADEQVPGIEKTPGTEKTPELIRDWPPPWSVTSNGIVDANGRWVTNTTNNALAHRIVELANYAGTASKDAELLDWIEEAAKKSRTGISFDWVPSVEGEPSGFRFMRKHFIGESRKTIRAAIRAAREIIEGKGHKP
jgi:hypothetical protein